MKFNLVRPCAHCPFRNDIPAYLTPVRAAAITHSIFLADQVFICHETQDAEGCDNESACAGALIMMAKDQALMDNWKIRFAIGMDWLRPERLDMAAPVYDTAQDMIEAQER